MIAIAQDILFLSFLVFTSFIHDCTNIIYIFILFSNDHIQEIYQCICLYDYPYFSLIFRECLYLIIVIVKLQK